MRRLAAAPIALGACVLAACGGGGASTGPVKPVGPAVDEKTAEKDATSLVEEIYETLNHGKADSMFSLLNDPLIVFGPRRADATVTRSEALISLGKLIDPKAKSRAQVRSSALAVIASSGGHSAWAFDVVNVDGQLVAALGVLTNDKDLWAVSAAAIAKTPTMKEIRAEARKQAVVPTGATSPAKIDDRARGAVDRFKAGLLDGEAWGEDLTSRSDAMVIGPSRDDITKGKKDIKRLWQKRLDAQTRAAVSGEIAAATTPDGMIAWVTAPVTRVEKDEDPLPERVFAVFEKNGEGWKMIALQESVAFDAPGAAAPFLKIMPPPAGPTPEEKAAAEKAAADEKETKEKAEKAEKDKKAKEAKAKAKAKKKAKDSDDEDDDVKPKKKFVKKKRVTNDDDDEDDKPKKKVVKKKPADDDEDDDDKPKKKVVKKKLSDDDDDDDKPRKKVVKKKLSDDDDEADDDKPKKKVVKKRPADDDDDDDDRPKKKPKKKQSDDDDE